MRASTVRLLPKGIAGPTMAACYFTTVARFLVKRPFGQRSAITFARYRRVLAQTLLAAPQIGHTAFHFLGLIAQYGCCVIKELNVARGPRSQLRTF